LLPPGLTSTFTENHGWGIGFFYVYFGVNVIVKEVFAPKPIYTTLAAIRNQITAAHGTRFDK